METIETPTHQDLRQRTEAYVRDQPAKAVGIALGAGILLSVFPVFRILGALIRLFVGLLKPALMIFGAVKLYEQYSNREDV